jgi:4-aminobutyrate aminotransferase/(S)-3-amino-2-methylpropionate transaminase
MFAVEHENMEPDMIVSAKGIAGGLPLAAVTARAEIMDSSHVGGLGGTYGGNPIACAAALAVIEMIEDEKLLDRAEHIGKILFQELNALKAKVLPEQGCSYLDCRHIRKRDPFLATSGHN